MAIRRLHTLRNLAQSAILILGMAAIAAACGWLLWGGQGVLWTMIGVGLAMALTPSLPPALVLSFLRARPLDRVEFPDGYAMLDALARRAGLPATPELFYVPSPVMNAMAVGGRHDSAVAVTDGMLRGLSPRELAGVLAHEVGHIANGDLWVMSLAAAMSRLTTLFSYFGMFLVLLNLPLVATGAVAISWAAIALLVLAPTLMNLLQLALSRTREYEADLDAARLSGDPAGLASALAVMERRQGRFWEDMFAPGGRVPEPTPLRSHPPTDERIRRLMALERAAGAGVPVAPPAARPAAPAAPRAVRGPAVWHWPDRCW